MSRPFLEHTVGRRLRTPAGGGACPVSPPAAPSQKYPVGNIVRLWTKLRRETSEEERGALGVPETGDQDRGGVCGRGFYGGGPRAASLVCRSYARGPRGD